MRVELYVYDLSQGMARQLSGALLGTQIDAVYHTAVVFGGVEYFYGAGIQTCRPGTTHHGKPMEVVDMGETSLPQDVIAEYLMSLKEIYTAETYDLFLHNCNNFSNDFCTFLVGKGIPHHITSLPQTVLNTPFGQMMKPQLDQAMRGITQAPVSQSSQLPARAVNSHETASSRHNGIRHSQPQGAPRQPTGIVHNVTSMQELKRLLEGARRTCAAIFFTSATCPPCRLVYPAYDELAAEAGSKATLIKVDISRAYDIASHFKVRATPTFMTFLKGEKQAEWSGADGSRLRSEIGLLLQMSTHPHTRLHLPVIRSSVTRYVAFTKLPPIDKLLKKMGDVASQDPAVSLVRNFVTARNSEGAQEATLPDMAAFTKFLRRSTLDLPADQLFAVVDLFRVALVDPRFSGALAEECEHATLAALLKAVNGPSASTTPSYPLRITTLQALCNLFTSPLYPPNLLSSPLLTPPLILLISSALLDAQHPPLRVAAASLAINLALASYKARQDGGSFLSESDAVELAASLAEAISVEEGSAEAARGMMLALALLVLDLDPEDGGSELWDLFQAVDARGAVARMAKVFPKEKELVREVGEVLGLDRGK